VAADESGAKEGDGGEVRQRLVFVTGPSGAGRSTAVKALEDVGFETIDNIPLSLLDRLFAGPPIGRSLAVGMDIRNRDFSVEGLREAIDRLSKAAGLDVELLYLDCREDVLIRRYSETRRRHPLARTQSPSQGIEREIELLAPIRQQADILIDTSDMTPHELRAEIERWFEVTDEKRLSVLVQSFSYKRGIPRGVDMVFDCRFLRNPFWDENLRTLDGRSDEVADYVRQDARYDAFFASVKGLADLLLPAFSEEGKSHIAIAFGCTGGQHRSVAMAESLAKSLAASEWRVSIRHREIERRDAGNVASATGIGGQT